jgi:hypothetical protein
MSSSSFLSNIISRLDFRGYIVSNLLSETTMCLQTFIVKTLIIGNMNSCYIYMKRKEGAREQDAGETEKESVRESEDRI